ncbi:SapC family protein [Tropicimonas sp. IMCC6043]|uniref:SapC family protein n=1 Tax=Tropicimonas sp. IMCC6043 TaxID=2510645 RepID=UPI00101D9C4C|nr:SapC family protein [Tropicimonas sp. IMCC6043]RYH07326.1 multidrug transporter [Tropicimonas sp. IMCC6043]
MATQLLFYEKAAPVTFRDHGDLSVRTGGTYGFARKVNSVPLTAVEFSAAAAAYPIVFAGDDTAVMPAVILGARANENLFVDADGRWTGSYIPAFVRRYPFVFSAADEGKQLILHIDETFEGCNRDGHGERLFDAGGERTQYLQNLLRFLQEYQGQFARTQAYCKRLKNLDLLQPMQAQFRIAGGEERSVSGFFVVDREKLKAIETDALRQMFDTDELECTYLHLHSLRHFNDMVKRLADSAPEASAAAADTGDDAESGEASPEAAEV